VSQLITLYLTPVIYTYMAGLSGLRLATFSRRAPTPRRSPA
jgi:hypothetical protein